MARKRLRPWFRKSDQCWYTTHNRKSVKLGTASDPKELIEARFRELVALTEKPDVLTVQVVVSRFLAYCKAHRSAATHRWYKDYLDPFCAYAKRPLPIDKLTPSFASEWIASQYSHLAASTQHAAARAITRAMNWAVAERLIERSPLVGFVKPAAGSREAIVSPGEFKRCLANAKQPVKDALVFMYETGCRPQEFRIMELAWLDDKKITFPVAKSKGKKKRRVIYLNPKAHAIATKWGADFNTGPMFRNSRDEPWTKDSLNCAFRRLRAKTEIPGLCAYTLRHTRITELLKSGVDVATVAALMGNSPRMILDVYQHVARDSNHLLNAIGG